MHETSINWTRMLFNNARESVGLNGSLGKEFRIERGLHQGCPLAPHLFFIVGEVLHHIFKKALAKGRIKGLRLAENKQQCLS